ncbi:SCO family protein [Actinomadura madurae]|uniref:SCO family protein n=1 Tax=Actinomadura madurae TaxID=1993 RepID=UPI002027667D|nr:SCO family protein [Actinomadura madurae]MCP9955732.1 SCO family protein [Actinomadura madurae]MCP9972463.1 SCO family protein [Actinomadura madurae]MCP9984976.1 SCO family protein [Actinomadura madurae]MCQ0003465.1 SCO family protein [Actinomadura madurae]MCQ0021175.1 SCO family protein [Actinomadura madurae]
MSAPTNPRFSLTDHFGNPVTETSFRGRWQFVFFGFTHCRSVCPQALRRFSAILDDLGDLAYRLDALYITVDPDRDTPTVMKEFLSSYPRFTGLTGSTADIESVMREFRAFAVRVDDPAEVGGYRVPHTAMSYLISPSGDYVTHFSDATPEDVVSSRLRLHLTL